MANSSRLISTPFTSLFGAFHLHYTIAYALSYASENMGNLLLAYFGGNYLHLLVCVLYFSVEE